MTVSASAVVISCGGTPTPPTATTAPAAASEPAGAPPSPGTGSGGSPDVITGPWLPSPVPLADSQIAVVSDACAAAARDTLGEAEADLPTAVVDARGGGVVVAILSDGSASIECIAQLGNGGATVDSIDRLSLTSFDALDGSAIGVTELAAEGEGSAKRTVAAGRTGPNVTRVAVTLGDGSKVDASAGATWWAAWWPGDRRATTIASVDQGGAVQSSINAPGGDVESRLAAATWWLDPEDGRPSQSATTINALVHEEACASGQSGVDRLDPPDVAYDDTTITVRFDIRRLPDAQDCQGNAPFPFALELAEPVGTRTLLDGSTRPPRDATKPPPGA